MAKGRQAGSGGSLFKRGKKGAYYVQYYANGKRKSTRLLDENAEPITDRRKAETAARSFLAPLRETKAVDQLRAVKAKLANAEQTRLDALKPPLPLSLVWDEYEASQNRPKSGPSTLRRYHSVIKAFNKWLGETYPDIMHIRDVNDEHAGAYAVHMEALRLSPSSFNIYLNSLTTVWATLSKKAGLVHNPFAWDKTTRTGIERQNVKAQATLRKKRALSVDEVNAVIDKAQGDYRTLLIILVCTGQRLVDGVKLQWKEIDLQEGIISLIPQKTATRTGKQVLIPILPQLREELDSKSRYDRYVLPDLVAVYERDRSAVTKQIRKIFTAAKLNAHKETNLQTGQAIVETGAQSLRHSFVSIACLAGIPDVIIQTITGHASIEMVDHYTRITAETVKTLSASMPKSLGSGKEMKEPVPDWVQKKIKSINAKNWKKVKAGLLKETS